MGNFLELIRFRVVSSDEILKIHILKAPSYAKYLSRTIQNELICFCGAEIITGINSEIKEQRSFSTLVFYYVIYYEVRYCSTTEQMSFVTRFVDKSC